MSITPIQAIRQILIDQRLATDSPDEDWRCVLFRLPDGEGVRDNILAVVDLEYGVGDRYISTGEIIAHPRIRIICRSTDYDEGCERMMRISDILDRMTGFSVTVAGETVIIHNISRNSGIVPHGQDATMRRHRFSLDYEIHLEESHARDNGQS